MKLTVDQIGIMLTGLVAVFLTQSKHEKRRRRACLFGMAGQPFWIYAALHAGQPGVLVVNVLYTFAWGKGVWLHWLAPWILRRWDKHRRPRILCEGCQCEIDPELCWCGNSIPHSYMEGHQPVPAGCICGYEEDGRTSENAD